MSTPETPAPSPLEELERYQIKGQLWYACEDVDPLLAALATEVSAMRGRKDFWKAEAERYEEAEGACCPEDVGFPEYIASLEAKLASAEREAGALREDKARLERIEWADTVLLCHEDEPPERRFSFRDMATPPTEADPDGTIWGPTARAVLDAARALPTTEGTESETATDLG